MLTFLLPFFQDNFYQIEGKIPIKTENIISFLPQSEYYSQEYTNELQLVEQKLAEKFPHKTIFRCKYGDFVVFPNDLTDFVTKNDQICWQPATTFTTDAFYFLFDKNKNLLKNTNKIDENTNFSILARVNYGFDLYNKNGKYFGEDFGYSESDFGKISEINTFIGEKIDGKCEKLKCKIHKKSLPREVLEAFETDLNYGLDLHEEFEKISVTNDEIVFDFSKGQKIMENFILSEWHHY